MKDVEGTRKAPSRQRDSHDVMEELTDILNAEAAEIAWDDMFGDWNDKDIGKVFSTLRKKGGNNFTDGMFAMIEYAMRTKKIKSTCDIVFKTKGLPEAAVNQIKELAKKKKIEFEEDEGSICLNGCPLETIYIDQGYLAVGTLRFAICLEWEE